MALLQSEILDLFEKASQDDEKVSILKQYDNIVMRALLRLNYDSTFKFDLPEGEPPYRKETGRPIGYQETNLTLEQRRFYIWLDPSINLSKIKKEKLFIEMLEGLHYTEAEALCLAKDQRLETKYHSLTEEIVREAYPTLLPPPVTPTVQNEGTKRGKKKALSV